jgi:hypothetical protein
MSLTNKEKKAQQLIVGEVNKALDMLQNHFKKYCEEVAPMYNDGKKSDSVPIIYIEQSIKIFKESFNKSANGQG